MKERKTCGNCVWETNHSWGLNKWRSASFPGLPLPQSAGQFFLWMFSMEAFYLISWDMGGSTSLLGTLCALTSESYLHPTPLCLDSGLSWKPLSMKCPFLSSRCHLCSVLSWANANKILTLPVKVSTQKWTEVQLPQDQETRTSRLLKLRLVLRCMYKSLTWSTDVL